MMSIAKVTVDFKIKLLMNKIILKFKNFLICFCIISLNSCTKDFSKNPDILSKCNKTYIAFDLLFRSTRCYKKASFLTFYNKYVIFYTKGEEYLLVYLCYLSRQKNLKQSNSVLQCSETVVLPYTKNTENKHTKQRMDGLA